MTEYKSLRVPVDAWEAAKAQKEDADRTWGDQIVRPDGDDAGDVDLTTLMDEIQDMKEGVEFVDAHVDSGGVDTREILNRLDDLETQLPTKVKEELQQ